MNNDEEISVTLPLKLLTVLHESVEAGEFASISDVVHDAIRLWEQKRLEGAERLEAIRGLIGLSIEDQQPDLTAAQVDERLEELFVKAGQDARAQTSEHVSASTEATEFSETMPSGQPVLGAALERLAEEVLGNIVEGAFCTAQEWDHRIDCCIKLDDGQIVGEMVPLSTLDGSVLRAVAERLKSRKRDSNFSLHNELRPPILIWPPSES